MAIAVGSSKAKLYIGSSKVKKAYLGTQLIYSAGNIVTYVVDTNVSYQEEVDEGASCLSPKTFTPSKSGWMFVGWRENATVSSSVLSSKVMGDSPITLYAVFRASVTVSYNGNGSTSGSTSSQSDYRYYNNGDTSNPTFTLRSNGFTRTNYSFYRWRLNSASGTAYNVGASYTASANATFYAEWISSTLTAFDSNNPDAYNTTYLAKSFSGKSVVAEAHINGDNHSPVLTPINDNPKTGSGTFTIKQIAPYSKVELKFKVRGANEYTTERVSTASLSGAISASANSTNDSATTAYDNISDKTFTLTSPGTVTMTVKATINGDNGGAYTYVSSYLDVISAVFKM